jgi:hypothetical protein
MPAPDQFDDADSQDLAEVFDEENITEDGRDIATSDMQRDVFDATSVEEDANEALEPQDDFDPDTADEAELEEVVMADEDLDQPRTFARDDADLVADEDLRPADLESERLSDEDIAALGYADDAAMRRSRAEQDEALDEALEETFPASDPLAISPGAD